MSELNRNLQSSSVSSAPHTTNPDRDAAKEEIAAVNKYPEAPYRVSSSANESISPSDGSLTYTVTDLALPGKNGLDLVINRVYQSSAANEQELDPHVQSGTSWLYHIYSYGGPSGFYSHDGTYGPFYGGAVCDNDMEKVIEEAWDVYGDEIEAHEKPTSILGFKTPITVGYYNSTRANNHYRDLFGLGYGWRFGFPSIETVPTRTGKTKQYDVLHLEDGRTYRINERLFDNRSNLLIGSDEYYPMYDLYLREGKDDDEGFIVLYYKDGKCAYFDSDSKTLSRIQDRYGNRITFTYNRGMLAKIVDTFGRTLSFQKTDYMGGHKLQIIRTDTGTALTTYLVDSTGDLRTVTDAESRTVSYDYTKYTGDASMADFYGRYARDKKTGKMVGVAESGFGKVTLGFHNLTTVTHPTGAQTKYTYKTTGAPDNYTLPTMRTRSIMGAYYPSNRVASRKDYSASNEERNLVTYAYGTAYYDTYTNKTTREKKKNYVKSDYNVDPKRREPKKPFDPDVDRYNEHYFSYYSYDHINTVIETHLDYTISYTIDHLGRCTRKSTSREEFRFPNGFVTIPVDTVITAYPPEDSETLYDKLPTKRTKEIHNPDNPDCPVKQIVSYEYDKNSAVLVSRKGNVTRETHTHLNADGSESYSQCIEREFNPSYSVVTEETQKKDDAESIVTKQELGSNGVITARKVFTKKGTAETLVEWTKYGYTGNLLTSEDRYVDLAGGTSHKTKYVYDETGARGFSPKPYRIEIEKVKDANGEYALSPYGNGLIRTEFTFDWFGRTIKEINPNKAEIDRSYDNIGRLLSETYPPVDGIRHTKNWLYRDDSNTVVSTSENGHKQRMVYNSFGDLYQVYAALGDEPQAGDTKLLERLYNDRGLVEEERTFEENGSLRSTVVYDYDHKGRITGRTTKDSSGSALCEEGTGYYDVYDGQYQREYYHRIRPGSFQSRKIVVPPPLFTLTSEILRDQRGNVVRESTGSSTSSHTYDKLSNRTSTLDGRNCEYTWTYNHRGQPTVESRPLGQTVQTKYDDAGNKIETKDPAQNITKYDYDIAGRLIRQTSPFSDREKTVLENIYDAAGNIVFTRQSCNLPGTPRQWRTTEYRYDGRNRQTDVLQYSNSARSKWEQSRTKYDGEGNLTELWTGLTEKPGDLPQITTYEYNRFGSQTSMLDARSKKLPPADPAYRRETREYDRTGKLLRKTDRNGTVTTFTHDDLGRLTREEVTVQGLDGPLKTVRAFEYILGDYKSGETETTERNGEISSLSTAYSYNSAGLLVGKRDVDGFTYMYWYDGNQNRSTFRLTRGETKLMELSYGYDELNRLTSVKKDGAEVASYLYDANGNRERLTYPQSGCVVRYGYNDANLVTSLVNNQHNKQLSAWDYQYRLDGNQISKTENKSVVTSYDYDLLGRLVKESSPGFSVSYEYDRFSNRIVMTEGTGAVTTYNYNDNNWLLAHTKTDRTGTERVQYRYDANGNQVYLERDYTHKEVGDTPGSLLFSKPGGHGEPFQEVREYDGLNRLVRVQRDTAVTELSYLPDGLRRAKRDPATGQEIRHLWDGQNMVGETDGNTNLAALYVRGINLILSHRDGQDAYYLMNAHGDVIHRVTGDGSLDKRYDYDAFGNERDADPADGNPFRYCGEYLDLETNTYYLRNRNYSPTTGHFLTEDPARSGLNWYTYCLNNPILMIDPLGLDSYILYDPNDDKDGFVTMEKLELMKQELKELYGTDVHLIDITSGGQFEKIWNGVGEGTHKGLGFDSKGNPVSVDATLLMFHGDENGIGFKDGKGGWNTDNLTRAEIKNLNEIYMDTLISFSCKGAQPGGSVTNSFFEKQKDYISQIIGADASTCMGIETTGILFWKKTSVDIYTVSDNSNAKGFKLYSNNSNSGVDYLGGLGYHFSSLTDLITMARGYK